MLVTHSCVYDGCILKVIVYIWEKLINLVTYFQIA